MQNSDSSRNNTLKAGNTKAKMTLGSGATSGNLRYHLSQFLARKTEIVPSTNLRHLSRTKTMTLLLWMERSGHQRGTTIAQLRIITNRYKDITDEYMKLTEADEERDRREKENQVESRNRHSLNSAVNLENYAE